MIWAVIIVCILLITVVLFFSFYSSEEEIDLTKPIYIFSQPTCGHCVTLQKNLHLLGDKKDFIQTINIKIHPEYISQYHIESTPMIICVETEEVFKAPSEITWEEAVSKYLGEFIDECVETT